MSDPSAPARVFDTNHILLRRLLSWLLDALIVSLLLAVLHVGLAIFGLLTLGLGWLLFGLLPAVPFVYSVATLAGRHAATPGQRLMGLGMAHHADGRGPTALEAFVWFGVFCLSLGCPPLLLLPLVTPRHRMLHDIVSGLLLVRTQPLTARGGVWNMGAGRTA